MSKIGDRMREVVLVISDGNAKAFARKTGIPYGTLQGYFRDRIPHSEHIERMIVKANINSNWLLTGRGNMLLSDTQEPAQTTEEKLNLDTETLSTIISWLEARLKTEKKTMTPACQSITIQAPDSGTAEDNIFLFYIAVPADKKQLTGE